MSPEELRQQIADRAARIIAGDGHPLLPDIVQDGELIADYIIDVVWPAIRRALARDAAIEAMVIDHDGFVRSPERDTFPTNNAQVLLRALRAVGTE